MTRDPLLVPDGLYCVPDPGEPQKLTYWSVISGVVRDYPPEVRWRPLPPALPADTPREERARLRQEWYERVYHPWRDRVDAAIAADPDAAAARFRVRFPEAVLPDPAVRPRRARTRPVRPRRMSRAEQQRAAEMLAAHALRQAGMSVRGVAGVLELPTMTAWRRVRDVESTTAAARARAALLARADRLQAQLVVESVQHPEQAEQITRWIADLREAVAALAVIPARRDCVRGDDHGG